MILAAPSIPRQAPPRDLSPLRRLFAAIGRVRRAVPDPVLACVPWMQVKHPLVPAQEDFMEKGTLGGRISGIQAAGRLLLALAYAVYLSLRILQVKAAWGKRLRALRAARFDLVAKSWGIGNLPGGGSGSEDFYLGDLQGRVGAEGASLLVLFGDPNGQSWKIPAPSPPAGWSGARLCELALVPAWAPLTIPFRQARLSLRLRSLSRSSGDPLVREVAARAAGDVLSRRILHNALYLWVGSVSARLWRPKGWISLYEGNSWEQCLWKGAKSVLPECRTIGYQHTILLRHNLSLLDPEGSRFNERPDLLLCLGPRTRELMAPGHPESFPLLFGSFRAPRGGQAAGVPRPERRTVLVVPEGYPWEGRILLECAIRAARLRPDWRFILRCHPVLPFERIRGLLQEAPERLSNVEVSRTRSLQEDLASSSVLLYRGSSVVLYALLDGLKPVYVEDPRAQEVDPLFELARWRERVGSAEELSAVLGEYGAAAEPQEGWDEAARYVREYVLPVTAENVRALLRSVERSDAGNKA